MPAQVRNRRTYPGLAIPKIGRRPGLVLERRVPDGLDRGVMVDARWTRKRAAIDWGDVIARHAVATHSPPIRLRMPEESKASGAAVQA
jgi:hypothetical protein